MKIAVIFLISFCTSINLDDLEVEDSDMRSKSLRYFKKYFPNKYKYYSKEELKKYLLDLHLGINELPSITEMKKWSY